MYRLSYIICIPTLAREERLGRATLYLEYAKIYATIQHHIEPLELEFPLTSFRPHIQIQHNSNNNNINKSKGMKI